MRSFRAAMLISVLVMAVVLAACGNDDSSTKDSTEGASGGGASTAGEQGSDVTVGYAGFTLANPFFAGLTLGLQNGAAEAGYDVIETDANGDPAKQLTQVEDLLSQGIDYLIIAPIDEKASVPMVEQADGKGVPSIALTGKIPGPVMSTLEQNHTVAAEIAAKEIVRLLEEKNGSAKGNVVDIEGLAGTPATNEREQGFVNIVSQHPEIKVVARADGGYDTNKSNEVMANILQAEPQIDAVYAANDAEAVGALSAIRNSGRFSPVGTPDHIILVSIDGALPAITAIRNGEMDATVSQQPIAMAEEAIHFIVENEEGKEPPKYYEWPSQVITPENIDSQEVADYGIWADMLGE